MTIKQFGKVTAVKRNGSNNTVHQDTINTIDFLLSTPGWKAI